MSGLQDIVGIRNSVSARHHQFIDTHGGQVSKVLADHALFAELALSKLKYLLNIFVEEKIIDKVEEMPQTEPFKKLRLSREGSNNYIVVVTDGNSTVVEGFNYLIISGLQEPNRSIYLNIQGDDFKWGVFAMDVLDKIHAVIYERKEAVESQLKNALNRL